MYDSIPPATRRQFLQTAGSAAFVGWSLAEATRPESAVAQSPTAPADAVRSLQPSQADLGSLYADVARIAESNDYPDSFLHERFRDYEQFQPAARAKVEELLQYQPPPVEPAAEIVDRADLGDYVREKVVFSTTPHFCVPAYVLIPKGLAKPAPAIVDLHSHGGMFLFGKEKVVDLGDNHPAVQEYHSRVYDGRATSTALVRRGYVVITIDTFMFGERRTLLDADRKYGWDRSKYSLDDVRHLNRQCARKETTLAKSLVLAGATWPGIMSWDDRRTVDYLVSRPEVDPARIGCLGISMGGYRSAYLAGLDDRIRAACVVGFMSTVRPMLRRHIDTHSWVHFLPELHRHFDLPDVAALHAPKPLLVQQCSQDALFPLSGMQESVEKMAAIYDKAGANGQFEGRFYDIPHRFSRQMQDEAFEWLDRQLGE